MVLAKDLKASEIHKKKIAVDSSGSTAHRLKTIFPDK
jgi:hypothetical protein